MKDSRVGTYAVVVVSLTLVVKVHALALVHERGAVPVGAALVYGHALSRSAAVLMCRCFPYVSDDEDDKALLYNSFAGCLRQGYLTRARVAGALATALAVGLGALAPHGPAAVERGLVAAAVAAAGAAGAGFYATGVIGGVIGDFVGATIVGIEVLTYAALAAETPTAASAASCVRLALAVGLPCVAMRGAGAVPEVTSNKKEC